MWERGDGSGRCGGRGAAAPAARIKTGCLTWIGKEIVRAAAPVARSEGYATHIARHNISRAEAEQVVESNLFDLERQIRNGERRMLHLGETATGRVLFVVVTVRNKMLRVVTAFPANRKARKFYAEQKQAFDSQETSDS
jgi:uncharacterized DUF497 family protein